MRTSVRVCLGLVSAALFFSTPFVAEATLDWSSCHVQSNTVLIGDSFSSNTITLDTPLTDTSKSFVLVNASGTVSSTNGEDQLVTGSITSTTDLTIQRSGTTGDMSVSYSVIECLEDEFTVQAGSISLGSGATTNSTFITAVDVNRSLVLVKARTNDVSGDITTGLFTGELNGAGDTVTVTRAQTGDGATVVYQVIEFSAEAQTAGLSVNTGEITLNSGDSQQTVAVGAYDPDRSWLYCSWDATDNGVQQSSVGCNLPNTSDIDVNRFAAGSYTNRVRYFLVEFPEDAVSVQRGITTIDPSGPADGEEFTTDIPITNIGDTTRAFPFVTNTVSDTSADFPRQVWTHEIVNNTLLQSSFWRTVSTNVDETSLYYQIIQFASLRTTNNWGWLGNSPDVINPGTGAVYGPINFNCSNLDTWLGNSCDDGTSGTRYDYTVDFEYGGCGSNCAVTGQAWVGATDVASGAVLGMIDFDSAINTGNPGSYPVSVGDDAATPENELQTASWNEETGELYGWARFYTLANYESGTLGALDDTWGWIKLRGTIDDGSASEYGVRVTDDAELSGWAWSDDGADITGTKIAGTGIGWVKFDLDISGTLGTGYVSTQQGDVYSGGNIGQGSSGAGDGFYGATYLIQANGSLVNFDSELDISGPGAPEDYTPDTSAGSIALPSDNGNLVYRGDLGTIRVGDLITNADVDITGPVDARGFACNETYVIAYANPLDNRVLYCNGDMRISNNLTVYNGSGEGIGAGTIIVQGDLHIEDNINYFNNSLSNHVYNLASLGWIVLGDVIIDSSVTEVVGAFTILDDGAGSGGTIETGSGNFPLTVQGLVAALTFTLQRTGVGTFTDPAPSELFIYDGRLLANPPPGYQDFSAVLPTYDR